MTDAQTPEAPEQPPQPASAPEKTHFQIVYSKYDSEALHREGLPSQDPVGLTDEAVKLLQRYDVREVFLVTVHAAYGKESVITRML